MSAKLLFSTFGKRRVTFGSPLAGPLSYIAGISPGLVTVAGAPASRQVEVRHRITRAVVATTWSASDGTYKINDLDPTQLFDVIARDYSNTYNDVIRARVTPAT
jgi:hypothetical protein